MANPAAFRNRTFKPTIFNSIQDAIQERSASGDAPIALHVGDTWFDIPKELNQPLAFEPWNSKLSRYGNTQGEIELRKRLYKRISEKHSIPIKDESEIQITFGATGALFLAMNRLMERGDEVLVLSPYWTIFRMVAATAGVKVVEVPFFDKISEHGENADITAWLDEHKTDKTAAIYYNNPNNPSGVMLAPDHIKEIAEYAKKNDLWVLSDEAYEDFVWSDTEYLSIASLPDMYERTVSIYSFSKSFASAGIRIGYAIAPTGVIAALNPGHVGVGYEPARPAQVKAIRGLEHENAIVNRLRNAYQEGLKAAVDNIKIPYIKPEGSFYLFVDLRDKWKGISDEAKLKQMLNAGVVVSPGAPFGAVYDGWARFCFTAESPDIIAEAARRMNNI
jgi:aspartate aminotransferase